MNRSLHTRIVTGGLHALAWGALVAPAAAQELAWIRQIGTTGEDTLRATVLDGMGGVIVVGTTWGSLTGPISGMTDAWVARYDAQGVQLWGRQHGTLERDDATAAAQDGLGGVYVAGATRGSLGGPGAGGRDVWVTRFDGSGQELWSRQFGTVADDWVMGATFDGAGGVILAGSTAGDLAAMNVGSSDVWVARYDGSGTRSWLRQFGSSAFDVATAAAADGQGGAFVAGVSSGDLGAPNAGRYDVWLARYDVTGTRTWIGQFGSLWNDDVAEIGVHPDGDLTVCGTTFGLMGPGAVSPGDAWVACYDGAGTPRWIRQFGTRSTEGALALAVDGSEHVFVAGRTSGHLCGPSSGGGDAWLARYDAAGERTWQHQFGTFPDDSVQAAAVDASGALFVGGETDGSLGAPHVGTGYSDVWIARYTGRFEEHRFCPPDSVNSRGATGGLSAGGSNVAAENELVLTAYRLPTSSAGYFLASRSRGFVVDPGGSRGTLCLGGAIGRFDGPGHVTNTGFTGEMRLAIDLTAMPTPTGSLAVQPGETWVFQAWYRDVLGAPTSDLTEAIAVAFQ